MQFLQCDFPSAEVPDELFYSEAYAQRLC